VRALLGRGIRAAALLVGVSFITFLLLGRTPGDFASALLLNPQISPATVASIRAEFALDAPLLPRYGHWLQAALRGHLGYSTTYRIPVEDLIWRRAANTLLLTATALLVAWTLAIAIGVTAAAARRSAWDRAVGVTAAALLALPDLLIALALLTFAAHSGVLPAGGMTTIGIESGTWAAARDLAAHMAIPVTVLALSTTPVLLQHVRSALQDSMPPPLAISLHARGLPRTRLVVRHALRLASAPLAALGGVSVGSLLSAGLLVEVLVGWPGLGSLLLEAVTTRDQYLVIAATMLATAALVAGNALADLLLHAVDPRVRGGAEAPAPAAAS
jgi:peptide/nickel transport system permease protein